MATPADTRFMTSASDQCDHDARASGRLVLEEGGVRQEVICDCGLVLIHLGREAYHLDPWAARHRLAARKRRRSSRALRLVTRLSGEAKSRQSPDANLSELAPAPDSPGLAR